MQNLLKLSLNISCKPSHNNPCRHASKVTGSAQLGAASLYPSTEAARLSLPSLPTSACMESQGPPTRGQQQGLSQFRTNLTSIVQAVVLQQTIPTALSRRRILQDRQRRATGSSSQVKRKARSTRLENKSPQHSGRRERITPSSLSRS